MMSQTIETMMCAEHKRLISYITDFEIASGFDAKRAKNMWQRFKWNLEKHFFIEEKAIFSFYNDVVGEEVSEIFEVMDQHGKILDLVKEIEKDLKGDVLPKTIRLKLMLSSHANFEDATLYPLLDLKMTEEHKKEIISRAHEIIRG